MARLAEWCGWTILLLALIWLPGPAAAQAQAQAPAAPADRLFLLKRAGEGVALEAVPLPDGETRVFPIGGEAEILAIVLPPGPGRSSDLRDLARPALLVVRRQGDRLTLQVRGMDGGAGGHGWTASFAALRAADIRISVTTPVLSQAFLIRGWTEAGPAPGPVFNPFSRAGMPGAGQMVIETDTRMRPPPLAEAGEARFRLARFPIAELVVDGRVVGPVIVDTGAAVTAISDSVLPPGAAVRELGMASHSAAGADIRKFAPSGATGAIGGVAGETRLAGVRLGTIGFGDLDAVVIAGLEAALQRLTGERTVGVIGLDLLARAPRLSLVFDRDRAGGTLRAGPSAPGGTAFTIAGGHIFLAGTAGAAPVSLILDTGSSGGVTLDDQAAAALGFVAGAAGPEGRGLDGGRMASRAGRLPSLAFAGRRWAELEANAAPVAIFETMRARGQHYGLVGAAFLRRFDTIGIDFAAGRISFAGGL